MSIQETNSHKTNIHLQTFNALLNPDTGTAIEYRDLIKNPKTKIFWTQIMANEFGRLAKGVKTIIKTGTETIEFIKKPQVTHDKTVTYAQVVAELRPQKA